MDDSVKVQRVNGVIVSINFNAPPTYRKGKLVCNKATMQLAPIRIAHAALNK